MQPYRVVDANRIHPIGGGMDGRDHLSMHGRPDKVVPKFQVWGECRGNGHVMNLERASSSPYVGEDQIR